MDRGYDAVHFLSGLTGGEPDDGLGVRKHLPNDPPGGGDIKFLCTVGDSDLH